MRTKRRAPSSFPGIGQLSLVEHALCPLDSRRSQVANLVHRTEYRYVDKSGDRRFAQACVFSPLGLLVDDEFYLWGLLALSLLYPEVEGELRATRHWCLRQLGIIDHRTNRGGRQYQQFTDAVRRLSAVSYLNDGFYDPIRKEHRRVSFGFFSYSLPLNVNSDRVWRFVWDPVFLELVKATAGHLRFDLATYRRLDGASRRLFLFASKVFSRRRKSLRAIPLERFAVDLLGYAPSLSTRDMKAKVTACTKKLVRQQILETANVRRVAKGRYSVELSRGPYFTSRTRRQSIAVVSDSPLLDSLQGLGFERESAASLVKRYPAGVLTEWIDITQAALERHGNGYFSNSPMAFLVDSVHAAVQGRRTPPDWWHTLKREEEQRLSHDRSSISVFEQIREELFPTEPLGTSNVKGSGLASVQDVVRGR